MDKKVIVIIILLGSLFAAEIGQVKAVSGNVRITKEHEVRQPLVSSRIYANEWLLLEDFSFLKIETAQKIWQIQGPARVQVLSGDNFVKDYGSLSWNKRPPPEKNLGLAILQTALFPGWGHWYAEDYFKAVPMLIITPALLLTIANANPEYSKSETAAETRLNFQQIYLVYTVAAVLDVWSIVTARNAALHEEL